MAFSRHNIEKRRLIELVRLNPILWDCRLPHYKRSDKKKTLKWNELGRIFGVSGERVQRTFTSLREIFRRELNHEKMLGARFKSKWEYYDAMAFLKEVIRERKSRERNKPAGDTHAQQQAQHSNNNSSAIDEYQYFAPNDPNNPNNQAQSQVPEQQQQQAQPHFQPLQQQPMQLHLQQLAASSGQQQQQPQPQSQTHTQSQQHSGPVGAQQNQPPTLNMQPADVNLSGNVNGFTTMQCNLGNGSGSLASNSRPPSQQPPPQQQQQHQPQLLPQPQLHHHPPPAASETLVAISSSRSSSSSPSIYIKDEPDSPDTVSLTTVTINEHNSSYSPRHATPITAVTKTKNAQGINSHGKAGIPINNNNNNNSALRKAKPHIARSSASLIIDEDFAAHDIELDDLDDPDVDMLDDGRLSVASTYTLGMAAKVSHPTAREILYTKFGDFLAARLNTLNETVANDLMNRILLLIAEK
ncbi:uncharacterized protein LOC129242868 [Anastrepha obliqua]|uniref:uncharacterized protein LOC129242868 n=1 Tax=Anastrepha obliqua TaxID=95512 RepID=UPI0024094FF9|nr:uncharacterized protein LOC129242868 [Anastrepha obliqua]XP_054735736.1 uncharacterized protein LOC129242868 [Anastrepha obliqua]